MLGNKIAHVIRDISPDNDHDRTVFDHIVAHYGDLSDLRTDRINHSLLRLPPLLKTFLYIASSMTLFLFILMPFANVWYGVLSIVTLAYLLAMVMQLIEDLDNPFVGFWKITPEPFERAFRHIEEDY